VKEKFARIVFRTFDSRETILQGTTECYLPSWLQSCNTRDRIEFNRNHLPRLRNISSVPYIEGTIRLRIMHAVHTESAEADTAFAYASRAHAFKCAEDSKREMVNDSVQPTVTGTVPPVLLATI